MQLLHAAPVWVQLYEYGQFKTCLVYKIFKMQILDNVRIMVIYFEKKSFLGQIGGWTQ